MTTQDKVIKTKLGLLRLANHLNNVSQACRTIVAFPKNRTVNNFVNLLNYEEAKI